MCQGPGARKAPVGSAAGGGSVGGCVCEGRGREVAAVAGEDPRRQPGMKLECLGQA